MDSQPTSTTQEDASPEAQLEVLEQFVLDNDELMRLEELASPFNIFKALGVDTQEIRHSSFLAWLLDPTQTHGLRDIFLKGFLMKTTSKARALGIGTISPVDIDVWDLSDTEVQRERQNIDIILVNQPRNFVCVIENKIDSEEHGDQLRRYRKIVESRFPDLVHHFIFLTARDEEPTDSEHYVKVTYDDVCEAIDHVLKMRGDSMSHDVQMTLSHYLTLVRRWIMPDQEIQRLCRQIWSKHSEALKLIFEHRADLQSELKDALIEMIDSEEDFILDMSSKQYIRFLPKEWDTKKLKRGDGRWTSSRRMLMLQFQNKPDSLMLTVHLGPGDEAVRREVFDIALNAGAPFKLSQKMLAQVWQQLYQQVILTKSDYEEGELSSTERMMARVKKAWADFKAGDLVTIQESLEEILH